MRITVDIPEDVLQEAKLPLTNTGNEMKKGFAVWLYTQGLLGAGKARELAGVDLPEFYALLSARGVRVNYDEEMLEEDLKSLEDRGI